MKTRTTQTTRTTPAGPAGPAKQTERTESRESTEALRESPAARAGGLRSIRTARFSLRYELRSLLVVLLLVPALLAACVLLVGTGDFAISGPDVLRSLAGGGDPGQRFVVQELRLPRVLVGLLVGASLGLGGALFQAVTRNPLGSPDVLGLGQGAAAGALVVIVLFSGSATAVATGALVGGLATGFLIYVLAWRGGVQGYRLVLVGIGASAVLTAVNGYLLTKADLVDAARAVVWITGSLNGRDWSQVWPLLGLCAVLVPLALTNARPLRMMDMGDDTAHALGVRVERTRLLLMTAAVLLTAAATAAAGPVGFVALTAPQLARRLTRSPGPNLLAALVMGAALLVTADWATQRLFGADQLPVGVLTGVLGGGYLLWLLVTQRRAGRI